MWAGSLDWDANSETYAIGIELRSHLEHGPITARSAVYGGADEMAMVITNQSGKWSATVWIYIKAMQHNFRAVWS